MMKKNSWKQNPQELEKKNLPTEGQRNVVSEMCIKSIKKFIMLLN